MVKIFWNERGSLVNHVRTYWTQIYVRIEDCLSITRSICLRNCSALDICWSEVIVMFIKDILRARPRIKQGLSPLVIVHDRLLSWNDWHCNIVATVSNDGGQLYMIILNFVMNLGVDDQVFWWASLAFFYFHFHFWYQSLLLDPIKMGVLCIGYNIFYTWKKEMKEKMAVHWGSGIFEGNVTGTRGLWYLLISSFFFSLKWVITTHVPA